MKYERLTKRVDNYPKIKYCSKDCETISCVDCGCCDELDYALYRLAELEDKIENGTLVFKEEIPCKVGDEVYHISVEGVRPGRIIRISVLNEPICIDTWCGDLFIGEIGGTIFFTKDEAEKRLEELRGENKEG